MECNKGEATRAKSLKRVDTQNIFMHVHISPAQNGFHNVAVATMIGTLVAYLIVHLRSLGQDSWKIASALMASYIGAINYVVVLNALDVSPFVIAAGVSADNVICAIYFMALFALGSKLPIKALPLTKSPANSSTLVLEIMHPCFRQLLHSPFLLQSAKGTASVVLAGLISALKLVGRSLANHKFLFLGDGEARTGIAELIALEISKQTGAPLEKTRKKVWLVDSKAHDHEPVKEFLDAVKANGVDWIIKSWTDIH
nr:NADP-dependent malic enzyme [Tanacetum cinerariifolium]